MDMQNYITSEKPKGSLDGINCEFILAHTPVEGTEQIYFNGLRQTPGVSNDYIISGLLITFPEAPEETDTILVNYQAK